MGKIEHRKGYRFQPQPDLTAYELCQIQPWLWGPVRVYFEGDIPAGLQRHFQELPDLVPVLIPTETRTFYDLDDHGRRHTKGQRKKSNTP